jgi:hypothetical protein
MQHCRSLLSAQSLMSIELLDFWIAVNDCGHGDMPSFALFDSKIGAASDDQRRPPSVAGAGHCPNIMTPEMIIQMS